ncbi:MAG: DUF3291 domain-containing protein [Chloroflexota bacterium]
MPGYQLAQLNVARLLAPIDSPIVAEFKDSLDPINALAEVSPGFVWRLQTEKGDATSIRVSDDDLFIVNLCVWESVEQLHDYVYRSDHTSFLSRRKEWFERSSEAFFVMWWIPAGHIPGTDEAMKRLALLRRDGPSVRAFTFKQEFAPPE